MLTTCYLGDEKSRTDIPTYRKKGGHQDRTSGSGQKAGLGFFHSCSRIKKQWL